MNPSICSLRLVALGRAKAETNGIGSTAPELDGSVGHFDP